jgi:hypothetical protein
MLLVCLCAVALCSCVGVDSRLTIRNDGSGTLTLDYRIARQAADFGRVSDESVRVPLPVEKADFLRAIDAAPGVRLTRYRRRSDEEQVVIHAVLAFRRLEDLAGIPALRDAGLAFSATGSTRTLTQVVAGSPDAPATPESLAMIDSIFAGAAITVILSTPSPMTPGGVGTLSPDRRTLTWSATLGELARRTGSVVLSATW